MDIERLNGIRNQVVTLTNQVYDLANRLDKMWAELDSVIEEEEEAF